MIARLPWIELHVVDHCNNVCKHCNQRSPFAAPRAYCPHDYLPALSRLSEAGAAFDQINLTGGEPFLHPDLTGFAAAFRARFPDKALVVISNGFWLSERAFDAHAPLFNTINALVFSLYPNIVHDHGGRTAMLAKLASLKARHPSLEIVTVGRNEFYPIHFDVNLAPRPGSSSGEANMGPALGSCRFAECVGLLADGRLSRCSLAAHAHLGREDSFPPFADRDLYFDTKGDVSGLAAWLAKWPLSVCSRCTAPVAPALPWKTSAPTRRTDFETAYFERITNASLPRSGEFEDKPASKLGSAAHSRYCDSQVAPTAGTGSAEP